jgi:hypothetical protein
MDHAHFLQAVERGGRPTTFKHYFNANLQKKRDERMCKSLDALAVSFKNDEDYIAVKALRQHSTVDKENEE